MKELTQMLNSAVCFLFFSKTPKTKGIMNTTVKISQIPNIMEIKGIETNFKAAILPSGTPKKPRYNEIMPSKLIIFPKSTKPTFASTNDGTLYPWNRLFINGQTGFPK